MNTDFIISRYLYLKEQEETNDKNEGILKLIAGQNAKHASGTGPLRQQDAHKVFGLIDSLGLSGAEVDEFKKHNAIHLPTWNVGIKADKKSTTIADGNTKPKEEVEPPTTPKVVDEIVLRGGFHHVDAGGNRTIRGGMIRLKGEEHYMTFPKDSPHYGKGLIDPGGVLYPDKFLMSYTDPETKEKVAGSPVKFLSTALGIRWPELKNSLRYDGYDVVPPGADQLTRDRIESRRNKKTQKREAIARHLAHALFEEKVNGKTMREHKASLKPSQHKLYVHYLGIVLDRARKRYEDEFDIRNVKVPVEDTVLVTHENEKGEKVTTEQKTQRMVYRKRTMASDVDLDGGGSGGKHVNINPNEANRAEEVRGVKLYKTAIAKETPDTLELAHHQEREFGGVEGLESHFHSSIKKLYTPLGSAKPLKEFEDRLGKITSIVRTAPPFPITIKHFNDIKRGIKASFDSLVGHIGHDPKHFDAINSLITTHGKDFNLKLTQTPEGKYDLVSTVPTKKQDLTTDRVGVATEVLSRLSGIRQDLMGKVTSASGTRVIPKVSRPFINKDAPKIKGFFTLRPRKTRT